MRYTQEMRDFIAGNVQGRSAKELAKLFNEHFDTFAMTASMMKSYKANHDLPSGTIGGIPKGTITDAWPKPIYDFIHENHKGVGPKEMATKLNEKFGTNYTQDGVTSFYKNHKLNSGLTGRFQKGNIPPNKGKKGVGGWEPTQFKKNQRPHNYMPVDSERVNSMGYTDIKIADPNVWRAKHLIMWEKANGPVPKGNVVIFGDGDRTNLDINNFILVTRRQFLLLKKKGLIQEDANLTRTGVIIADIYAKIIDITKEKKGKR